MREPHTAVLAKPVGAVPSASAASRRAETTTAQRPLLGTRSGLDLASGSGPGMALVRAGGPA